MQEGWQSYLRVVCVKADTQGRFLIVKGKIEDVEYSIVNVYGPNKDSCARNFFLQRCSSYYWNLESPMRIVLLLEEIFTVR